MSETGLKLLLVEDNPVDARWVLGALQSIGPQNTSDEGGDLGASSLPCRPDAVERIFRAGFQVQVCGSLAEALGQLEAGPLPDALLLDLMLPDSQGLGTLCAVRRASPDVPVVVLTADADQQAGLAALEAGAQDYLVKGHWTAGLLERSVRYALARSHLEREQRQVGRMVLDAGLRERMRTARELHDGVGQQLTGLSLLAASLQRRLAERGLPEAELADTILSAIRDASIELRNVLQGLMPVADGRQGLRDALKRLCESTAQRSGLECRFEVQGECWIDDNQCANHLYRIAQEAMHNVVKHAGARRVVVCLERQGDELTLAVEDDGCGFDSRASAAAGLGLRLMRHRTQLIGGRLSIGSPACGSGCRVSCSIRSTCR